MTARPSISIPAALFGLFTISAFVFASAHAQIDPMALPSASLVVTDASGAPVEGALACIGTVSGLKEYGQEFTNAAGVAHFHNMLPEGPATIYYTAGKDGHGVQTALQYSLSTPPNILTAHVQLPASPGGVNCPGGATGPLSWLEDSIANMLQGMEAPTEVVSREIFEARLILKRPPPVSIVIALESSHPALVSVPRQVRIGPRDQTVTFRAEVTGDARRRETVILTAHLEADPRQIVRAQLVVRAADERK